MNRGPRKSLARDQSGQLLVMWLIFMLPMVVVCFSVYNVGVAVSEKMKVQTAADNAAYSEATWNARYLNLNAYISRAMVANYDTIAVFTSIWSFIDATDGFIALIRTILRAFFDIGDALTPVAQLLHRANEAMAKVVGGGKKGRALGYALETYNNVLSYSMQALYIGNQLGRARVAQTIAWGVDPKIQYFDPGVIWGLQDMANRRDWKKNDAQDGLRLTLERSLNKLSNGGSFRDSDNFPVVGGILRIINAIPCLELKIGPHGYDGPKFNHKTGQVVSASGESGTVIAKPDEIYELDHNGLEIIIDCPIVPSFTLISFGHFSDDKKNLPNAIGLDFPHVVDEEGDHGQFISNNLDCSSFGGSTPSTGNANAAAGLGADPQMQRLQQLNQQCASGSSQGVDVNGNNPPDLPPEVLAFAAPGQQQQLNQQRIAAANQQRANANPPQTPISSSVLNDDVTCQQLQDQIRARQEQLTQSLRQGFSASGNPCRTAYQYDTPLADVKVTHYMQKDSVPDGKRVEGPSVFVYVRKKGESLPLFRGLGLFFGLDPGKFLNIEAYAFGRAYYTQRPDAGTNEKETAFNPFWAGRLEKAPIGFH